MGIGEFVLLVVNFDEKGCVFLYPSKQPEGFVLLSMSRLLLMTHTHYLFAPQLNVIVLCFITSVMPPAQA